MTFTRTKMNQVSIYLSLNFTSVIDLQSQSIFCICDATMHPDGMHFSLDFIKSLGGVGIT